MQVYIYQYKGCSLKVVLCEALRLPWPVLPNQAQVRHRAWGVLTRVKPILVPAPIPFEVSP